MTPAGPKNKPYFSCRQAPILYIPIIPSEPDVLSTRFALFIESCRFLRDRDTKEKTGKEKFVIRSLVPFRVLAYLEEPATRNHKKDISGLAADRDDAFSGLSTTNQGIKAYTGGWFNFLPVLHYSKPLTQNSHYHHAHQPRANGRCFYNPVRN
jgi:hypothetical protein